MKRINITKEQLETLLKQNLSSNKIAKLLNVSAPCVRNWMKKWNLSSNYLSIKDKTCYRTNTHKQCPCCGEIKSLEEFDKRPNGNVYSYCRKCCNDNRYKLLKRIKLQIVEEMGGCCSICGYNKNLSALEFHHLDMTQKDFTISNSTTTNIEKIREEISKCILVCANCHRELHYPQNNLEEITQNNNI